ncbi:MULTISPECIES: hypothetical protein [Haloarcula]|uniref:hypothetical protein n=1 Tax=Haloarcula TaxID=2237 RepID=UPI0023E831B1|nr:hypothetical protein [Halomicroarcula sp. SHR3]
MSSAAFENYRPALVTLHNDIRDLKDEYRGGLRSQRRLLTWLQEITVRTIGEIDAQVYEDLPRELMGEKLGMFVVASVRPHEGIDDERARRGRELWLTEHVTSAYQHAFRTLRTSATEYVDSAEDEDAHAPDKQSAVAMRPSLREWDQRQATALTDLLDGFDEREEISRWLDDVIMASYGEASGAWMRELVRDEVAVEILCGQAAKHERARRILAADKLLPNFRRGIRKLANNAAEVADAETESKEAQFA